MYSPIAQVSTKILIAISLTSLLVWGLEKSRVLAWTIGLGPLPRLPVFTKNTQEGRA